MMKNNAHLLIVLLIILGNGYTLVAQAYVQARINMHIACYQEKDYEECARAFSHQLSMNRKVFPMDWIHYGAVSYVNLEQFDSAVWCIEQAILRGVPLQDIEKNYHLKKIPQVLRDALHNNYKELRGKFENSIDKELLELIIDMHEQDQFARRHYRTRNDVQVPWEPGGVDEINGAKLEEIVKAYGWPGFSLLGHEATKAYTVLIHSAFNSCNDENEKALYYPLLEEALKNQEITPWMFAWYVDRFAVKNKTCQTYGTATKLGKCYVPVSAPDLLNERRKSIGLVPFPEDELQQINSEHACQTEN